MTRRGAPSLVLSSLLLLLLVLCPPLSAVATDTATLVRVVDGDTVEIELNDQTEKGRLIGINTPEKYESDKLHRDATRTGQELPVSHHPGSCSSPARTPPEKGLLWQDS
jgi:endonuclease YncB( thermonuclease family)